MLIDNIIELAKSRLTAKKWKCNCPDCIFSELQDLTDDDIVEVIKNYDRNILD